MSSQRLFRFPKPAWLNSATTRTAGVYLSGALVQAPHPMRVAPITLTQLAVFPRLLLLHRCLDFLPLSSERL
jgi:hypothetical protein